MRVSQLGGTAVPETELDAATEVSHDYPEFLPDGRHYVYLVRGQRAEDWVTYVGTLGSKERRRLAGIRVGVRYSPTGHLLFLRGLTVMAQPFDIERLDLAGDPFPIAEQVLGGRIAPFSIAANGSLAFLVAPLLDSELAWFDRRGRRLGTIAEKGEYFSPILSSDGRFVAFFRGQPFDVWILDVERNRSSRLTSGATSSRTPIWKPGDRAVVWSSLRDGKYGLYRRSVGNDAEERVLEGTSAELLPSDWSRDGRYVAYQSGGDVWVLPISGGPPLQVTTTPFVTEARARFSPDGRWIAYESDEATGVSRSAETDIYIRSFPEGGVKQQVSANGGTTPRWSADGRELFFIAPDGTLMAASVAAERAALDVGMPTPLFRPGFGRIETATFDVASDGRFLVSLREPARRVRVVLNGTDELRRRAAGR